MLLPLTLKTTPLGAVDFTSSWAVLVSTIAFQQLQERILTGSGMVEILVEELEAVSVWLVDFAQAGKRTSLDDLAISAKAGGMAIVATRWLCSEGKGEG